MARLLPATGVVYYNGFTFPSALQARCQAIPIVGTAGWNTKYTAYTFTIETIIVAEDLPTTPGTAVDDQLETIRSLLEKPGKAFHFTDQGLGDDLIVNDPTVVGSQWDVRFGPRPTIIAWEPAGSNTAARVIWTVEVTLSSCLTNNTISKGITDFSYDMSWSIKGGLTVRTIRGTLEVAGLRGVVNSQGIVSNNTSLVRDVADQYRERLSYVFPIPRGFDREYSFTTTRNGQSLDFVIVDNELPSEHPYLAGIGEIEATDRASSKLLDNNIVSAGLYRWARSLRARILLRPGAPRYKAWEAFLLIFNSRYQRALREVEKNGKKTFTNPNVVVPLSISFEESLFSREFNFAIDWTFATKITDFFTNTGFMQPVTDSANWDEWHASQGVSVSQSVRGYAGMKQVTADLKIIDLCNSNNIPPVNSFANKQTIGGFIQLSAPKKPPPDQSYAHYDSQTHASQEKNVVILSPGYQTPTTEVEAAYQTNNKGEPSVSLSGTTVSSSQKESHIQVRGPAETIFRVMGNAVRLGYPVPIPTLQSIAGGPVYLRASHYDEKVVPGVSYPIYMARWLLEYTTVKPPIGDISLTAVTNSDPAKH